MRKFYHNLFFMFFISIFIFSCSDNAVLDEEDKTDNLFPLFSEPGNYWIFEHFTIDTNNKIDASIPPAIDSVFFAGTEPRINRQAYIYRYKRIQGTGTPLADQYFYREGNKIYAHSDIIMNFTGFDKLPIDLPIKFDEQWFLWINPSASKWEIAEKTLTNDTIVIPNQAILKLNGKITLSGQSLGKETIKIKDKNHKAHKFTISLVFDIKVDIIIENQKIPGTIKFTRNIHYWYVNKIGCVRQLLTTVKYNIPLVGSQTFYGYDATLIDYSVLMPL